MKKILFWFGVLLSLLIPMTLPLAESGPCLDGDYSLFLLGTEISYLIALFYLLAMVLGTPTVGRTSFVLACVPALLGLYFYVAHIPVYLYYSSFSNYGLCDIVRFDLYIGKPDSGPTPETFNGGFARSFAFLVLIPLGILMIAPLKIFRSMRSD
ncbi:hypothetical protein EHO61_02625 [Leptospira fluminis]|uniref:Uncharacterized protein n=1 Tax=Leptospira fluminis TaxID=2484979 RepID=A0A4R9GRH5_9LEPT|nr:hypothetical protein [Leptospira fluminis]TGK20782.1 hypothetical protein EHO61_02625 [Leptospira fluminis]